jgi:hypothetical protein
MAFNCWRSMYSRCASVISFSAFDWICPFSSRTSISRDNAMDTASSLTVRLFSSSSFCLSSGRMSSRLASR